MLFPRHLPKAKIERSDFRPTITTHGQVLLAEAWLVAENGRHVEDKQTIVNAVRVLSFAQSQNSIEFARWLGFVHAAFYRNYLSWFSPHWWAALLATEYASNRSPAAIEWADIWLSFWCGSGENHAAAELLSRSRQTAPEYRAQAAHTLQLIESAVQAHPDLGPAIAKAEKLQEKTPI